MKVKKLNSDTSERANKIIDELFRIIESNSIGDSAKRACKNNLFKVRESLISDIEFREKDLVCINDICVMMGRSKAVVYKMVQRGMLPPSGEMKGQGARHYWKRSDVERFIKERKVATDKNFCGFYYSMK